MNRWVVAPAYAVDDGEIRVLFEQVFGQSMSQQHWDWKYAGAEMRGVLLRDLDGKAVAFFGAMPRDFSCSGEVVPCVQNGDVMVLPSERAVFSKKGALYQISSEFFNTYVGAGRPYLFAFGFPNLRHFSLGLKLGLYEQAGHMQELRWPQSVPTRNRSWGWRLCERLENGEMDHLWLRMQKDWPDVYIPVRNLERWQYRFFDNPSIKYVGMKIETGWFSRRTSAMLMLREHDGYFELMDYLGGRQQLNLAVQAARQLAAGKNKSLYMLASDTVARQFAATGAEIKQSEIKVPVNYSVDDHVDKPWLNQLWLMAGDSDFM